MGNRTIRETLWVADALESIEGLLPDSWRLVYNPVPSKMLSSFDGEASLVGPGDEEVEYLVEAKSYGASSALVVAQLLNLSAESDRPVLFLSDYVGPRMRERLASEGISYADATGWVYVWSDSPLVLLTGQGATKSPRGGRRTAVARLNGVAVSRIIRALSSVLTPIGVRELATIADVSPGSVSKLLQTLVSEGIVDRDERGRVSAVRRRDLVRRWVQDYSFAKTNDSVGYFISPRGLERALDQLGSISNPVTLTGSAAARRMLPEEVTPVVPLRMLAIYADRPNAIAEELRLIPADATNANVVIALPQDETVLAEAVAPTALVLADLFTLPGRGDAEAEQLMNLLARSDEMWES